MTGGLRVDREERVCARLRVHVCDARFGCGRRDRLSRLCCRVFGRGGVDATGNDSATAVIATNHSPLCVCAGLRHLFGGGGYA
jgi:hypothetical protein